METHTKSFFSSETLSNDQQHALILKQGEAWVTYFFGLVALKRIVLISLYENWQVTFSRRP